MSLIHPNLDAICNECGRAFDSWTDLECPICHPFKDRNKIIDEPPNEFEGMNMEQRANHLFMELMNYSYGPPPELKELRYIQQEFEFMKDVKVKEHQYD